MVFIMSVAPEIRSDLQKSEKEPDAKSTDNC